MLCEHPGLQDPKAGSRVTAHLADGVKPHPAPFSVSRITEALIFVPAQLQADAVNVVQTLPDRAADLHTVAKLLRGSGPSRDVDAAAEYCARLAAARYCHHYEAALERVHLVFVASLREAASCMARLHVGSHPAASLAGALAAMQVSGYPRGPPGSVEASTACYAGAAGVDGSGRGGGCERRADVDPAVANARDGRRGAADAAGENVMPPAAHQWLRLEVVGACEASAPGRAGLVAGAAIHDPSVASGGPGDRAGAAAFASAFPHLRMLPSAADAGKPHAPASGAAVSATASPACLRAAPTFIGIHGFDVLLWGHAVELGVAKRPGPAAAADGSGGGGRAAECHATDAPALAAAHAAERAATYGRAAGCGPVSTSGAGWADGLDADRGAAFENPFVLSAAARTLALATSALRHSTSLWRHTEAGVAEKLSCGGGSSVATDAAHPWGPAAAVPDAMLHLSLLHPAALHLDASRGSDSAIAERFATEDAAVAQHASTGPMHLSHASDADRAAALALEHTGLASLLGRLGATLLVEAAV
jgi:hypothetical protein